ncbi:MAG: bifunctional diaminohydroxyphosphoribosylaminopyrimidine deaminase/5-amino-6-(5-phosphoribosylamino)uracil reductase RibD, partial [Fervidobacterium sp.]
YHKKYGGYHAERNAILSAWSKGIALNGATMYVTLEPCDHYGKTPPCTDLIIEAGIKQVYVACKDPNPVSGNGIEKLKKNGIEVHVGILESEARELAKFFFKSIESGIPYVTLKYAATLDGKIADSSSNSKWITNELRNVVHKLRHAHMAVLVGARTVLVDNPMLNVRLNGKYKDPVKIILDKNGSVFDRLFNHLNDLNAFRSGKVIVFTERDLPDDVISNFSHVKVYKESEPLQILRVLHDLEGIDSILLEGGATIFSQFLPYADEIYGFYGLNIFGKGLGTFEYVTRYVTEKLDFSIQKVFVAKNRREFAVVMRRVYRDNSKSC